MCLIFGIYFLLMLLPIHSHKLLSYLKNACFFHIIANIPKTIQFIVSLWMKGVPLYTKTLTKSENEYTVCPIFSLKYPNISVINNVFSGNFGSDCILEKWSIWHIEHFYLAFSCSVGVFQTAFFVKRILRLILDNFFVRFRMRILKDRLCIVPNAFNRKKF